MMYCNNCGAQNPGDSVFCGKCGNRLTPIQSTVQSVPAAPARRTNGLAIATLVLGIASFLISICAIPAIIMGFIALNQIKNDPGQEGKGMAIAGLICGAVVIFLWICVIILFISLAATSSSSSDFWVATQMLPVAI